jgi:uncharacterized UBP type Zn finger protein
LEENEDEKEMVEHILPSSKSSPKKEKLELPIIPNDKMLKVLLDMGFNEEIGKKALIQAKNASVEAALELVDEVQKTMPIPEPVVIIV